MHWEVTRGLAYPVIEDNKERLAALQATRRNLAGGDAYPSKDEGQAFDAFIAGACEPSRRNRDHDVEMEDERESDLGFPSGNQLVTTEQ